MRHPARIERRAARRRGRCAGWLRLLATTACLAAAGAAAAEQGRLPIDNFSPDEYGAHQQNWDVTVDRRGVVWVANSDGLLQYDGESWRPVEDERDRRFWSVAEAADGTLWVGASGEFGFLEPDPGGRHRFVSLHGRLAEEDREPGDIRQVLATADGIYFRSYKRLFRWRPSAASTGGRLDVWRSEASDDPRAKSFDRMAWIDGRLVVGRRDHGLIELRDGELVPRPGAEALVGEAVMGLLELDDGRLLAAGFRAGLFVGRERLEPWPTQASEFARRHLAMGLGRLADGRLALASFRGGLALFSDAGDFDRVVDVGRGLLHNELMNAGAEDRRGGLWLALNNGVARVEVGSPFERFEDLPGIEGSVIALRRFGERLYVGTTLGIFQLLAGRGAEESRFEPLPGVRRECWALRELDDALWAATSDGVFEVGRPEDMDYDSVAFDVADVAGYRLVATWRSGLLVRPSDAPETAFFRLAATSEDVRALVVGPRGDLWLRAIGPQRHERLERIDLSRPLAPSSPVEVYGADRGLPREGELAPFVWRQDLWVGSRNGLHRFDPESDHFVEVALSDPASGEPLRAVAATVDPRDRLWISSGPHRNFLVEADGSALRIHEPLRRARLRDVRIFYPEPDGSLWAGAGGGQLVRWRPPAGLAPAAEAITLIRSVRVAQPEGRVVFGGAGSPPADPSIFPWGENALRFEFALPGSGASGDNLYRSRLLGQSATWSTWSPASFREFTALREGAYRFEVQGMDAGGEAASVAAFAFRVQPPPHRSWWAYCGYLLLTLVSLSSIMRWRLRHVSQKADRLSLEVERRRRVQAKLESRNIEMERFLYTASHDLKGPLITAQGFADLLERNLAAGDQELARSSAVRIREATSRLAELVRDQLEVARVGHLAEPSEWVRFTDLADEALGRLAFRLDGVRVEIAPDLPEVFVDRQRLVDALEHLIENALRFRGEQQELAIEIGQRSEAGERAFFVRDNGLGIARENLKRVFELFQQLDPASGGTGIGLSIVRRIIEAHGGRIWAESEGSGRGTTVLFTLNAPSPPESPAPA